MDVSRIMVYDAQDNFMGDIPPAEVFERTRTEEINGANSLKLSTVHPLEVGNRLLNCDATGTWREYVVTGIEQGHTDGLAAYCTYYAVWSIQYDLTGVTCDVMPGVKSPVNARAALVALLGNTSQWAVGNVDVGTTGGASMWQRSAWEAMSTLIDVWGGEIAPRIEVDNNGVVSRLVDYRARVGATKVTRRFDYGADLADIKRKVADTVRYCRIVPLGAGSTDAVASADRKRVTIKSVNDGVEWLQNDSVVPIVRRPNGSGGWEYPTKFVIFDGVEDPQTLKDTALRALEEYTTPKVSYTAKVTQFAQAGVDLHGVAVGDAVDVVDKEFGVDGGLRLTSRIVKLVTDELQPENVTVTLGNITTDLSSRFTKLDNKVARVSQALANQEG
ncbi:phage tail spike protein, partial [uncultured Bifidobacterium sp.]|uniref:phage tail spike protein n=1 Tax=uncultured Bifidobacterium sp. TaxID=165187 RepID=UPI0025DEC83A